MNERLNIPDDKRADESALRRAILVRTISLILGWLVRSDGNSQVEVRLWHLLLCHRSLISWNRGPPGVFLIHPLQRKSTSPFRLGSGRR
jgi:hypothetical protein